MATGISSGILNALIPTLQILVNAPSPPINYISPCLFANNRVYSCPFDNQLSCDIEDLGTIMFNRDHRVLTFIAKKDLQFSGLGFAGEMSLAKAKGWISNGQQSWSASGIVALPWEVSLQKTSELLKERVDEFRDGKNLSWEYSAAIGANSFLFIGAQTARYSKSWVQFFKPKKYQNDPANNDKVGFRFGSGGTGESLTLKSGDIKWGEMWTISGGPIESLPEHLKNYALTLPTLNSAKHIGWNSWYNFWENVTAPGYKENLPLALGFLTRLLGRERLAQHKPVATLDDGWEKIWGEWEPNEKFPEGLSGVVQDAKDHGYTPGIWLAPWLVSVSSTLIKDHPSWFVQTDDYVHPSGRYKILDTTNPQVKEHLTTTLSRLRQLGFGFFKLDFLFTGVFEGKRYLDVTGTEAFHIGMKIIRKALGPNSHILACGAPHLVSRTYANSWRIGPDIAYRYPRGQPTWVDIAAQMRNISARWFLCHGLQCDTDPWLIRGSRSDNEIISGLWVASMTGGGMSLSDDFRQLHTNRLEINPEPKAIEQALGGLPAYPDLFAENAEVASELVSPSVFNRFFDTSPVRAPENWRLANGGQLLINFSEVRKQIDGHWLDAREHLYINGGP